MWFVYFICNASKYKLLWHNVIRYIFPNLVTFKGFNLRASLLWQHQCFNSRRTFSVINVIYELNVVVSACFVILQVYNQVFSACLNAKGKSGAGLCFQVSIKMLGPNVWISEVDFDVVYLPSEEQSILKSSWSWKWLGLAARFLESVFSLFIFWHQARKREIIDTEVLSVVEVLPWRKESLNKVCLKKDIFQKLSVFLNKNHWK